MSTPGTPATPARRRTAATPARPPTAPSRTAARTTTPRATSTRPPTLRPPTDRTHADASDSGTTCSPDLSACSNGGIDDLCQAGTCSACTGPSQDTACATAYGGAFLCLAGACTPGDCRTDANCPLGQICGLLQPNFCAGCSSDAQCQSDPTYGPGDICDTAGGGTCVSGACSAADDTACTTNPGDVCCSDTCLSGNCCDTPYCQGKFGNSSTCVNHTCTTCDPVGSSKTYIVDPLNGDDSSATGSGTAGGAPVAGCAFRTITRALQFLGSSPGAGTIVSVLDSATVQAGETFPIVVTGNVTVQGVAGPPATTIEVPASTTGFRLDAPSSGLANLVIDGTALTGNTGIVVTTGSATTTTLAGVTVQNMGDDGIDVVNEGVVTIGPGTGSNDNGSATTGRSGMRVKDNGQAIIDVASGPPATFNGNGEHGILVTGGGSLSISGSVNPAVIVDSNYIAGLFIEQTPVTGGTPPENDVSYLQATNSVTTNGIHVYAGSSLKLRNSVTGGNAENGIAVTTYDKGEATQSDDVSAIDLGSINGLTPDYFGLNTFQYASGGAFDPNGGAGICLDLTTTAAQTLSAAGNIFELVDCSTSSPPAIKHSAHCKDATDVAVTGTGTTNSVLVTNCD